MQQKSSWKKYYLDFKKKHALGEITRELDYGEIIYQSPVIPGRSAQNQAAAAVSWLVMRYDKEFNVFFERTINKKVERKLMASFLTRDPAMKFALESLLVSSGNLVRNRFSSDGGTK